jgi:hypothetical protein
MWPARRTRHSISEAQRAKTIISGTSPIIDSTIGFSWDIPGEASTAVNIRIRIFQSFGVPAERKFDIRAYRAPRLKNSNRIVRDGYGPGDTVSASFMPTRARGGGAAGARVTVSARIDGEETGMDATVDKLGNANAKLQTARCRLARRRRYRHDDSGWGTVEPATKHDFPFCSRPWICLLSGRREISCGSDQSRLLRRQNSNSKSLSDTEASFTDSTGANVAVLRSEHEGRGRFTFIPAKVKLYSFHVTMPLEI